MADYSIVFARSARRELEKLHDPLASRILKGIVSLAHNPRPPGCKKLEGADDLWQVRIAAYRVIYAVDDRARIVDIACIRHRRDAYR